jgi:hypothetical protein
VNITQPHKTLLRTLTHKKEVDAEEEGVPRRDLISDLTSDRKRKALVDADLIAEDVKFII